MRKHPVFLSTSIPPAGGKKIKVIDDLIEDNIFYEIPEDEIIHGKKINIYPIMPRIFNEWTLREIIEKTPPIGWERHFINLMPELFFLDKLIDTEMKIFPQKKNIFRCFHLCPPGQVKVVIVGPEPFEKSASNDVEYANGLCFSTNSKATKLHPATQSIYRELKRSFPKFKAPKHGDFESWARQGILFLNRALTVRPGGKKSHYNEWVGFFHRTILYLREINPDLIFVLWGSEAKSSRDIIQGKHVLEAPNPASYSGNQTFVNCDHFIKINTILQSLNQTPINWLDI